MYTYIYECAVLFTYKIKITEQIQQKKAIFTLSIEQTLVKFYLSKKNYQTVNKVNKQNSFYLI